MTEVEIVFGANLVLIQASPKISIYFCMKAVSGEAAGGGVPQRKS